MMGTVSIPFEKIEVGMSFGALEGSGTIRNDVAFVGAEPDGIIVVTMASGLCARGREGDRLTTYEPLWP